MTNKNYFECKLCSVNTQNIKYSEEISKRIKKNYNLKWMN